MKTPDEIMQDVGIDVKQTKKEKPLLYDSIRKAMDNFADQYAEWKLRKVNDANTNDAKAFIEKLKEKRNNINQKLRFVHEHKFEKEAQFLRDRINVIDTIMYELESVAGGNTKGVDAKFTWM